MSRPKWSIKITDHFTCTSANVICSLTFTPQKVIHRRKRETTRRPIPRTTSWLSERRQKRRGGWIWSGFYININLPTFFFLCTKLCANNANFVQRTTTTLYEECRLCKNNVDFLRRTSTLQGQRQLCKDNVDFARTTSTLQGQGRLCKDNDDFARTTTTLS